MVRLSRGYPYGGRAFNSFGRRSIAAFHQQNPPRIPICFSGGMKGGLIIMMLFSKAEDAGCRVIKVDPRDTTQECSRCGRIVPKILNDRRHNCPNCGLSTDMDLNTAVNILKRALLLLST